LREAIGKEHIRLALGRWSLRLLASRGTAAADSWDRGRSTAAVVQSLKIYLRL